MLQALLYSWGFVFARLLAWRNRVRGGGYDNLFFSQKSSRYCLFFINFLCIGKKTKTPKKSHPNRIWQITKHQTRPSKNRTSSLIKNKVIGAFFSPPFYRVPGHGCCCTASINTACHRAQSTARSISWWVPLALCCKLKKKMALFGLKYCPARDTQKRLSKCYFWYREVLLFLSSASQGPYGEERDSVRKWLPATFNWLLLEPGRHGW